MYTPNYKIICCIFFLLQSVNISFSQISLYPRQNQNSYLNTEFSKQNTSWNWLNRLNAADSTRRLYNWAVSDVFSSNLITPDNASNQWKDEHNLNSSFYNKYSGLNAGIFIKSWLLYDKQQESRNEFSNHSAGFFASFSPAEQTFLNPYAGYQRSKNISKTDWGWDVGVSGNVKNLKLGEYSNNIDFSSDYDFYEQRQNYDNMASAKISTRFSTQAQDSIKLSYQESSKQYFDIPRDSSDARLIEVKLYNRSITNYLTYDLSQQNSFSLETNILSKNVSYFTNRNVFFIQNKIKYTHIGPVLSYQIDYRTNDETLDNNETLTDSRTRQSALSLKAFYYINNDNSFNFDLAYVKMQYDTPDEENNDDRDEQRFILYFQYLWKISPLLDFQFNGYGLLFHQIYIFKEQSFNNKWNRVLKVEPQVIYSNSGFENRLRTSVIANYTVYDFDHLSLIRRSFISRKFSVTDSLAIPVYKNLELGIIGTLELEEKGNFFKEDFSQNRVQSYQSKKLNSFFTHNLFQRINLRFGYTVYTRTEWRYLPDKKKNRSIRNHGPFIGIYYKVLERINLSAYASINNVDDSRISKTRYTTGYLSLFYNL